MGSLVMLITFTVHCPSGYWFLNHWPHFFLFWLSEVVFASFELELLLPSSVELGGRHRCLLLPVRDAYTDHTIWQVITHSL